MRLIRTAFLLALAAPTLAFGEEVKKVRWDCVFPDKAMKEAVDATDEDAANGLCRDLWNKAKKAARRPVPGGPTGDSDGVSDDVFSKRSLE